MMLSSHSLVSELTTLTPQTMPLFIAQHLDCIGCSMAKFCTLEEVAGHYGLDLQLLLTRFQQLVDTDERIGYNWGNVTA
jgi:hybrid cluster-associated redox disulfide protein